MDELARIITQRIADGKMLGFTAVNPPADPADAAPKTAKLAATKLGATKSGVSQRR